MYVHSFEGGNPNSDGHLYRRTRYRDGAGDSAVNITAPNVWWDGFVCAGTTLANKQTNDPVNAACLQWAGENGTGLLSNFNINNYSKHGIGRTTGPRVGHLHDFKTARTGFMDRVLPMPVWAALPPTSIIRAAPRIPTARPPSRTAVRRSTAA